MGFYTMKARIIIPLIIAALFAGVAVTTNANLKGKQVVAIYQESIGTIKNCKKKCGARTDTGLDFTTEGTGSATWTANSAPDETRPWTEVQISGFTAIGQTPELGAITFSADDSRLLTSRIESDVAGAAFPATSKLRIHVLATVGGVDYRSITPVEVQTTLNDGDWPHNGATYTQIGTTDLERVDNPGVVALTLSNITSTMNATN